MRLVVAVILLLALSSPALAYSVTIIIKGYEDKALLNVSGETNLSEYVSSGDQILLPEGNYTFRLFAMNKTFEKDVRVGNNITVSFDLRFTNRTDNLSLTRHIIVYGGIDVMEVLMITNSGTVNFEGDLAVALPDYSGLTISDATLSFLDVKVDNRKLVLRDIIVPKNESGSVTYTYRLKTNVLSFNDSRKFRVLLLSTIPVTDVYGLEFKGNEEFKGKKFDVYEGYTDSCRVVFSSERSVTVNPTVLLGILVLSTAIFLYFRSRSGGWRLR